MSSLDKYPLQYELTGGKKRGKMGGTRAGGLKAVATLKQKRGDGYMAKIGTKGGKNAQELHPELQRFKDKDFARKMQKKSIKARLAKKVSKA